MKSQFCRAENHDVWYYSYSTLASVANLYTEFERYDARRTTLKFSVHWALRDPYQISVLFFSKKFNSLKPDINLKSNQNEDTSQKIKSLARRNNWACECWVRPHISVVFHWEPLALYGAQQFQKTPWAPVVGHRLYMHVCTVMEVVWYQNNPSKHNFWVYSRVQRFLPHPAFMGSCWIFRSAPPPDTHPHFRKLDGGPSRFWEKWMASRFWKCVLGWFWVHF